MNKNAIPKCSVIVLNYFGEKVIKNTLNSLLALDYPPENLEIIIVDNDSQDRSREILEEYENRYKNIKIFFMDKNLGFSAGNNIGIKNSTGEYVALLNNDCVVSKNWLKSLVETASKDPKTFAVASKILLYQKYLKFEMKSPAGLGPFYSYLSNSSLYQFTKKRIYFNLINKNGTLYTEIPYDPVNDKTIEIDIVFTCPKIKKNNNTKISLSGCEVISFRHDKDEMRYRIKINTSAFKQISKVQNAGIIPFQDGYARDIGAIVKDRTQYYEYDQGQFDKEAEVYAFCGAAVLLRKRILDKIGLLDETFFMYYEDVELSERSRLNGYKIYYSPKAEVRHIHALSSKEGSKFFIYHVEKGRLLHVFYNYTFKAFIREYCRVFAVIGYGIANVLMSLRYIKAIVKDKSSDKPSLTRPLLLTGVIFYFFINAPFLIYKKFYTRSIPKNAAARNYYQITHGRWYFN